MTTTPVHEPAPARRDTTSRRSRDTGPAWGRTELTLGLTLLAAYLSLGQWVVREAHVVGFSTLRRFADALHLTREPLRAESLLTEDPTPLVTLLTAPLTASSDAVASLAVVPAASALSATVMVLALHRALRHAQVGPVVRVLLLVGVALNPLVVLYATSGDTLLLAPALVLAAMADLAAYRRTGDLRALLLAGGALALAALADPRLVVLPVVLGAGIFVAQRRTRHPVLAAQAEGTLAALLTPTLAVVALWAGLGTLLAGRPVAWLAADGALRGPAAAGEVAPGDAVAQTAQALASAAPLVLPVLLVLVVRAARRPDPTAGVLAALLATVTCLPAVTVLLAGGDQVQLREAVLPLVVATAGAGLLLGSAPRGRSRRARGSRLGAVATVTALLVAWPTTWHLMRTSEHQVLEGAFVRAVETGRSQEGELTPAGQRIGYAPEQTTADVLLALDPAARSILVDPAVGFPVLALTGRPDWFRDHPGTAAWRAAAADPAGAGVRYLLLTSDPSTDRLARLHPLAAAGLDPALRVVHRGPRYVLVEPTSLEDGGPTP